jgi:hypothetical protein
MIKFVQFHLLQTKPAQEVASQTRHFLTFDISIISHSDYDRTVNRCLQRDH